MHESLSVEPEAQTSDSGSKRGGWITFPFITAGMAGVTLAGGGCLANMIVYLIDVFHVKSIDAAQIMNVFGGGTSLVPVVGAGIADSLMGCFPVIQISSFICLLGAILLTLTATLDSLRPQSCKSELSLCTAAPKFKLAVLYTGIALTSVGVGGMRFTIATMGANQFDKAKDRSIFFNWYLIILYAAVVVSGTVFVYVEDNVGWAWGFGLCIVANVVGLAVFVLGNRFYRHVKPQGSPFTGLARVVVAAVCKRNVPVTTKAEDYYQGHDGAATVAVAMAVPTKSFRFLNRAALETEGDLEPDGSVAKPWRLCSVQQVEDLKTLIRIFPLWSTGIFLSTPLRFLSSLIVLQALNMDRQVGPRFEIPAGSVPVSVLASTAVSLTLIDRFVYPVWQKLARGPPPVLHRVAAGHIFTVAGMAIAAGIECRRLELARRHVPMAVGWLALPLAAVGVGEAFHYPGQVGLYYREFPTSLRSTATAMIALHMGIAYYLSSAVIDVFRRVTRWMPDDINEGRLDYVYWTLAFSGVLNFGYYIMCARLYKSRGIESGDPNPTSQ